MFTDVTLVKHWNIHISWTYTFPDMFEFHKIMLHYKVNIYLIIQKTSDYRRGTSGRKLAPIIGRAVNQMLDFLTRTKIKFFGRSKIGADNWKRR